MIKFNVTPTYTHIRNATIEEMSIIREFLEYKDRKYFVKRTYNKFAKENKTLLRGTKFPTGFIFDVLYELDDNKIKYKTNMLFDFKEPEESIEELAKNIDKRPYQIECANKAIEEKRGYFQIATAGGKTEVARLIIQSINGKTLFLVHLKELVYQTRELFANRMGIDKRNIGVIGDGKFILNDITISTIQTISRIINSKKHRLKKKMLKWLKDIDVLFIDECHHSSSDTFYKTCLKINAPYRFGMSATPMTNSDERDKKLKAITGDLIFRSSMKKLKDDKYISDAKIVFYTIDKCTHPTMLTPVNLRKLYPKEEIESKYEDKDDDMKEYFSLKRKNYQNVYERGIVENNYRNKLIVKLIKKNKNKNILVLVERKKHIRILKSLFKELKVKQSYAFVTGSSSGRRRGRLMKEMNDGNLNIIVTTIFKEGANIPEVNVVMICGGIKSSIITKQRIGRGLRLKKGGGKLLVIDFYDKTHSFLESQSKKRMKIVKKVGFSVSKV